MPEKEKLIEMYRKMLKIRHFEEKVFYLFLQGLIPGTIHLYTGQEAVAVGVCESLREGDFITSTHRPHGHYIAKGGSIDKLLAELFGRKTGCCKGKGGSMHVCDISVGMPPAIGVVAAGIPIAAGMALSFKMRNTDQVVACFFGEGASNQGTFHEGINIAAVWRLPVIFICENNLYAASTHMSKVMLVENVAERASAYGIPGEVVDGNDIIAVYSAAHKAADRARKGLGPTLIECMTYRHGGHSRGDPATYRPKEEVEEWLRKDPIPRFRKKLIEEGILTEEEAKGIEEGILEEIEEAVKFAEESPFPEGEDSLEDVYA
ncbi:MAG: thiamine pyrophosphate-dependent dehydrogenase E1 component subunit alpha [Candidatus Bathyarchaeia archaeon]